MQTKLTRYCDGILEAAWLAAVVVVPIFFNVYSSRIFEPDKVALLRTLALVALAAWLVKLIEVGSTGWARLGEHEPAWKAIIKTPLVLPALALAAVYLIATVFSVSPAVSLWGSYQRLQGTYTTLSYLVFFAIILANMRQPKQVDRLITTVILASLPVALYGVLQRYQLDPIPWGGDTSVRIASNMGNSIFVAAYLIMVMPLTLARIVEKFRSILRESEHVIVPMMLATLYVFIGALQLIAIYMSGSRGPALGWIASAFVFFLLLSLYWKKRWLTVGLVAVAGIIVAFLLVLNIKSGPLETLRTSPAVGRFGSLMDAESSSALVRRYIWEGVVSLVSPHAPLEFPDGSTDRFNILRPLVGYGPESMYVAYNKFYVPTLGKVERRNASPDRSHNETWDSIVITGALGLLACFTVTATVFYYGFKWLGLILNRKRAYLFLGLYAGGGVLGAIVLSLWRGVEYLGVGLPFGIFLGLITYVVLVALFFNTEKPANDGQVIRYLILLGIISAILANFVESNFGISIAVTRTYFWVYAGLMVVVGYFLPRLGEYGFSLAAPVDANSTAEAAGGATGRSKKSSTAAASRKKDEKRVDSAVSKDHALSWLWESLLAGVVVAMILVTLGFNFLSNQDSAQTVGKILARLASDDYFGVTFMLLTTWVVCSVLFGLTGIDGPGMSAKASHMGKRILVVLGVSGGIGLLYALVQAAGLADLASYTVNTIDDLMDQVARYEQLLTRYYVFLLLLIFGFALVAAFQAADRVQQSSARGEPARLARNWVSLVALAFFMIVAFYYAATSNLQVIQADVAFKIGDSFARPGSWQVATQIYNRAIDLAPQEDYYYLFLGRANLEESKSIEDAAARDSFVLNAKDSLLQAQSINPLNTDHTANLARLYSMWATATVDATAKQERAAISSEYFAKAVMLSPNNARLWSEWALHEITNLQDEARGRELLGMALTKDPEYDWAYGLLADLAYRKARSIEGTDEKTQYLMEAAQNYEKAIGFINPYEPQNLFTYKISLASIYSELGLRQKVIEAFTSAGQSAPSVNEKWQIEEAIAQEYIALQDFVNARIFLQNALALAPEDQAERLQQAINQISGAP